MSDTLFTTPQAAAAIGCHRTTAYRVARQHGVGKTFSGRLAFTSADVDRLRELVQPAAGSPAFTPGNHFGKPPKKAAKKRRT